MPGPSPGFEAVLGALRPRRQQRAIYPFMSIAFHQKYGGTPMYHKFIWRGQ